MTAAAALAVAAEGLDVDGLFAAIVGPVDPAVADVEAVGQRLRRSDFGNWLATVGQTARGCSRPVRLSGSSTLVNPRTGEVVEDFTTSTLPDSVLYKPCGSRLASRCPACAHTYRYDTYHLLAAGLRGGKGVPESVGGHPALFVTLTAPSFGPVHTYITDRRSGRVRPCRPRRDRPVCAHGRSLSCPHRHHQGDPCVGTPLCPDCYDYPGQVMFNAFAPKLWARTIDTLTRSLRRIGESTGAPMRLRYAKVAEFQARGVVHFHAILRLDGYDRTDPTAILTPPGCLEVTELAELIRSAAAGTAIGTPAHPARPAGWPLTWGSQTDTRIIRRGVPDEQITDQHVAGYLAKYATKSTEAVAATSTRSMGSHVARLIDTCWQLGRPGTGPHYRRLRRKADMLGFAGHFSTKSRRYSTTLGALRAARRPAMRAGIRIISPEQYDHGHDLDEADGETTLLLNRQWTYTGTGWLTLADAALALASAAAARERRPIAAQS